MTFISTVDFPQHKLITGIIPAFIFFIVLELRIFYEGFKKQITGTGTSRRQRTVNTKVMFSKG
jgi:hypothetical protein